MVPSSAQGGSNNINAYISLCLGVSLSFSAALSLILLWRWAHQREGQDGLPTLAPGRTRTGIEPETVADFPSYRYKAECAGLAVTVRAASSRHSKQAPAAEEEAEVLISSRRASEPVLPSPRLAAGGVEDPIKWVVRVARDQSLYVAQTVCSASAWNETLHVPRCCGLASLCSIAQLAIVRPATLVLPEHNSSRALWQRGHCRPCCFTDACRQSVTAH